MAQDEAGDLLILIDRFEALLDASDLAELEVEAGGTMLRLTRPSALASLMPGSGPRSRVPEESPVRDHLTDERLHAVLAPLTGIFYLSPSPDAAPYVREGGQVSSGQVIGLIEAMKLFNEIKSDRTGTVRRIAAESGALVKQRQPLIEVEPS